MEHYTDNGSPSDGGHGGATTPTTTTTRAWIMEHYTDNDYDHDMVDHYTDFDDDFASMGDDIDDSS